MARFNLFLLVLLLGSALFLVHTQYQSRLLYTAVHQASAEARRIDTEHDRLQVEKRAQATPLRVEALARTKLAMRSATPAITRYISQPEGAAAGLAAAQSVPVASALIVEPLPMNDAAQRPFASGRIGGVP